MPGPGPRWGRRDESSLWFCRAVGSLGQQWAAAGRQPMVSPVVGGHSRWLLHFLQATLVLQKTGSVSLSGPRCRPWTSNLITWSTKGDFLVSRR